MQVLKQCPSIPAEHLLLAMLKQCLARATNVTNVLTYNQLTLLEHLTLSNARRGAGRFHPLRCES